MAGGNINEISEQDKQRLLANNKAPSSRKQSQYEPDFESLADLLGEPFSFTNVPLSKLYDMRRDPMLAFALHFLKVPLVRAPWYIKCPDAQLASFVDQALRDIYPRLVLQYLTSLDFGFSAIAKRFEEATPNWTFIDPADDTQTEKKVWDNGNIKAIVWSNFINLRPELVRPVWKDSTGEFDGIIFNSTTGTGQFPFSSTPEAEDQFKIDLDHSLWVTNEKDSNFGSLWGYPRLGYAAPYWWSYWHRWALSNRHFERISDPSIVVRFPNEENVVDENGSEIDLQSIAYALGENAKSGSTIALPSTVVTSALEDRLSSLYEWDISFLESQGNFDAFDSTFERLEVLKLRSIFVPEQSLIEGKGGSSSRNVADEFAHRNEESQAIIMSEFDEVLNKYMIPQLVALNFPEKRDIPIQKATKGFGSEDTELSKALVQLLGQRDPNSLMVDIKGVLEQAGVPTLSFNELEARQKRITEIEKLSQPPQVQGIPGQQSAIVPTPDTQNQGKSFSNRYVQMPERYTFNFSENDKFVNSLPDSKHFSDKEIKDIAIDIRDISKSAFSDAYKDFALFIEKNKNEFAEEDKLASSIVDKWSFDFSSKMSKIEDDLLKIMKRASDIELTGANLPADWEVNKEAEKWARERAGFMLQSISDTTKNELKTFLSDKIASKAPVEELAAFIEQKFSEFPGWKADRLARTETTQAYNFGTLFAGASKGVKQVQALDARKGPTDHECEDRNGKIFSLTDALREIDHPNGTLAWKLLKTTNLSVEPITDKKSSMMAYYDPEKETIYLSENLDEQDKENYLIKIVNNIDE